jgi:phosphatidylglycerol:prolipoprotein diacylglycerol transferase
MQPELDLGPITLQTFGIMFALGFLAAGAVLWKRLGELGKPPDWAYEIIFSGLVGGLVGSRIDFIIQNDADLLDSIFSGSGLVWYGGVIGGAVGVLAWGWYRGMLGPALLDLAAVPLTLGYAIGRIGCQLSGDGDYGKDWDGPWAMGYPDGTVPTAPGVEVHPTPVYETLAMGAVAYLLWRMRDRYRPGILFALYLVLAGTERLLVEFVRRNEDVALGLTQPQLISVAMILAGTVWLLLVSRRSGLRRDAQPAAAEAAA